MRVELFTFCWDEMDVIPWVISYWRKFASHVTVFDNGSTDGSIQFLQAHGEWIDVVHFETGGTINDTMLQEMKNEVWKDARGMADLVVVCDMDEVLMAPDIVKSLTTMRRVGGTICRPNWYDLVSDDYPEYMSGIPLHIMRPIARHNQASKAILFDPNAIEEINYAPGAHTCNPKGDVRWFAGDIYCLHINHNLSLEHKIERYRMMNARLSDLNKTLGHGIHYAFGEEHLRRAWDEDHKHVINFGSIIG